MSHADEIMLDDVYELKRGTALLKLTIDLKDDIVFVSENSEFGTPGAPIHLDCVVTLMADDGAIVDVMVLIETDSAGMIEQTLILPLGTLFEKHSYTAVSLDRENMRTRLADVTCNSFARGTMITLANRTQKPIEDLSVGDHVLTRDHGPLELRHVSHNTVRATGFFAPITIMKGALGNDHDLTVSPNHRIVAPKDKAEALNSQSNIPLKAIHLVDDANIVQNDGGYVDYYQLTFDTPAIIFAAGIPAESMGAETCLATQLQLGDTNQHAGFSGFQEATEAYEISAVTPASKSPANAYRPAKSK